MDCRTNIKIFDRACAYLDFCRRNYWGLASFKTVNAVKRTCIIDRKALSVLRDGCNLDPKWIAVTIEESHANFKTTLIACNTNFIAGEIELLQLEGIQRDDIKVASCAGVNWVLVQFEFG